MQNSTILFLRCILYINRVEHPAELPRPKKVAENLPVQTKKSPQRKLLKELLNCAPTAPWRVQSTRAISTLAAVSSRSFSSRRSF